MQVELYKRVKEGGEEDFRRYVSLLKMGGSDYPINEVIKAGVDLTSKEPFQAVVDRMAKLVEELKKVLEE